MIDITIIIPLYNKELFIGETLESISKNLNVNAEVIVIDDNSSDNSLKVVSSFLDDLESLTVLSNKSGKKGGSVCRNIGIENAKGEFVIFLDADDLLSETCLEDRIKIMENNPNLDFAVFPMGTFYKKIGDANYIWNSFHGDHLKRFLKHELPWAIPSPIWKTSFLKKIGGFDESFQRLQDVELHTKALLVKPSYKVNSSSKPDCFYRIDESRIETNQYQFMERWLNGVRSYINKFYVKENTQLLRGTYLSFVKALYYKKSLNQLSKIEMERLLHDIDESQLDKLFTSTKSKKRLKRYKKGLDKSFFKIRGYNFIYSKLLMKN